MAWKALPLLVLALAGASRAHGLSKGGGRVKDLLKVHARGGRVLRFPGLDLRAPGARWEGVGDFVMVPASDGGGFAGYRLEARAPADKKQLGGVLGTSETIPVLPNRTYVVSALIRTCFDRPAEINLGLKMVDAGGAQVVWRLPGLPNQTDGWERWEREITTDPRSVHAIFEFIVYGFPRDGMFSIADLAVVELPARRPPRYRKGEGVTFRGGPGRLPMRVEDVSASPERVVVAATGAEYAFDLRADTIEMRQRIETPRLLGRWTCSVPLDGLAVLRSTPKECVLANDHVTFGVQCDSLLMVVPHEPMSMSFRSAFGGKWNRLGAGHLLARDDQGGVAMNPDVPFGTGLVPRVHVGEFYFGVNPGRVPAGSVDFVNRIADVDFVSRAKPGWKVTWYLVPGERLGISACPPRPYPWADSFRHRFTIVNRNSDPTGYRTIAPYADTLILWDFTKRSWSFSWGREHIPYDVEHFRRCVQAARDAGMCPVMYGSTQWYYSRDAQEYVDEIRRMKDLVGIEGLYLDGIPGQEWVVAYEQMRMLRELFPDGRLVVHATGNNYNGNPPLSEPALKVPVVETYADSTYTGELVYGEGPNWAYPRYITSQYRLSNCIGVMKYDQWQGLTPLQRDMQMLRWNGRACLLPVEYEGSYEPGRLEYLKKHYFPILDELRKLWQEKGHEPRFYEDHYLPRVRALTEPYLKDLKD